MATNAQPIAVIARLLDLSERRIQQLSREGVIPKAERGQYDLVARGARLRRLPARSRGAGAGRRAGLRRRASPADQGQGRPRRDGGRRTPRRAAAGRRGRGRAGPRCWPGCAPGCWCCPIAWRRSATRRRRLPGSATRSAKRSARRSTSSPRRRSSPLILTGPERLATAVRAALTILRPPPELSISDWADANRRLSSEASAEPGQWRTSRAEYQRGIMDAISDGSRRERGDHVGGQVGQAEALGNCRRLLHRPGPGADHAGDADRARSPRPGRRTASRRWRGTRRASRARSPTRSRATARTRSCTSASRAGT